MTTRLEPRLKTAHVPNATLTLREVLAALVRPLAVPDAERLVASRFPGCDAVMFASARGALATAVEALAVGEEVAVPAYTCAAVANAVLSAGRRPIYVDVGARGLVPANSWPKGVLAVVQDTYGFEAEAPAGATYIIDAAHRAYPFRAGSAAVTVTSFEHSKSLSSGRGGLALLRDPTLATHLRSLRDRRHRPDRRARSGAVTLSTVAMGHLDFAGRCRVGQFFRKIAWHLDESRLFGQSVSELTAHGVDPRLLGAPDPGAARLMVGQIARAPRVAAHRTRIVAQYDRAAGLMREPTPLVRYPLAHDDPESFERALEATGWDVRGRWFTGPLHPRRSDLSAFGYAEGDAPVAERLAQTVVNLPTHPLVSEADADQMIDAALEAGARPLV